MGAVRLQVTNLDRSLAYYTSTIGLELRAQTHARAVLHASGEPQPLLVLEEHAGARRVPRGGLLGLYHFAILLPDQLHLGRYVRHLATTGVRFSAADHFVSEALYLWDPDGLGIEVYADRPRDTWRMRGNELVMTTESLDLHALVDAAGPESWHGMPPGTTMGHMHLSVGDLETARAYITWPSASMSASGAIPARSSSQRAATTIISASTRGPLARASQARTTPG